MSAAWATAAASFTEGTSRIEAIPALTIGRAARRGRRGLASAGPGFVRSMLPVDDLAEGRIILAPDDGLGWCGPQTQARESRRCYCSVAVARVLQLALTLGQSVEQGRHG
jgi:hypothetical protein